MFQRLVNRFNARFRISIRWKLLLSIVGMVIVFGLIHLWIVLQYFYATLEQNYISTGTMSAKLLSHELEEAVLFEDLTKVEGLLWKWKTLSNTHYYAMVVSRDSTVIASTFTSGVPNGLRTFNLTSSNEMNALHIWDRATPILDVSFPLIDGAAGWLRLGYHEEPMLTSLIHLRWIMVGMVIGFVFLGVMGSLLLSKLLVYPIDKLIEKTNEFNLNKPLDDFEIRTGDELETLTKSFSEMALRLQHSHIQYTNSIEQGKNAEKLATLGLLASGLAHEIANPVAGIEMGLNRVRKHPENVEQTVRYTASMLESLNHIQHILQQTLAFARPESVNKSRSNLHVLINQTLVLIEHLFSRNHIKLVRNPDQELVEINVDAHSLMQALTNILINAIDAMPDGGVISIEVNQILGKVRIEISDTGMGIPPKIIDQIWEPFFTTKSVGKGTGLGLSVTRSLIEHTGGTVIAKSISGNGTTFIIELPNE